MCAVMCLCGESLFQCLFQMVAHSTPNTVSYSAINSDSVHVLNALTCVELFCFQSHRRTYELLVSFLWYHYIAQYCSSDQKFALFLKCIQQVLSEEDLTASNGCLLCLHISFVLFIIESGVLWRFNLIKAYTCGDLFQCGLMRADP